MKIQTVNAREIFDSRGLPTLECDIMLSTGEGVTASVPSGKSRGNAEAMELRDTDRLNGLGVLSAVDVIHTVLAPLIIGKEPDVVALDQLLLAADGTEQKTSLGANSLLAVSTAICKAQALADGMEIYECIAYLCDITTVSLPFGMFNIVNGGLHANSGLAVQEVLIVPLGVPTFRESFEVATMVFQQFKRLLEQHNLSTLVGDEGGFAPAITDLSQILDLVSQAIKSAGFEKNVIFGLDMAASQWYDQQTQMYTVNNVLHTTQDLIAWYQKLVGQYPIYSIEDGLADSDWNGWQELTASLASIQLVADDLFATNTKRIVQGLERSIANAVIIKPIQIGTITETLQAVKLCQEYEMPIIISHRSGETNDPFIADLAVGCNALQIKAGGCMRGERMAKYNRLMRIEEQLLRLQALQRDE